MGWIRVIAGEFRGRRLGVPAGARVRPTADRVRESLFNILGETVAGTRVLDLFAGSGALGIEALSRGAREVVFVERDPRALASLRGNLERLGLDRRSEVMRGSVLASLRSRLRGASFDLVLADPPYEDPIEPVLRALARGACLAEGARVIVERDAGSPPPSSVEVLKLFRSVRYGQSRLDFYHRGHLDPTDTGSG